MILASELLGLGRSGVLIVEIYSARLHGLAPSPASKVYGLRKERSSKAR
jgi:hypothetical protein